MVSSAQVTEKPLHWNGEDRCPSRHDGRESNSGSCFRIFRGLCVAYVSHQRTALLKAVDLEMQKKGRSHLFI